MVNAFPTPERPYYGTWLDDAARALRDEGLDIDVFNVRGYEGKSEYVKAGLRAVALNGRRPYDIVHAHYGLMGLVGRLQVRSPFVITFTGGDIQPNPDTTGHRPLANRLKAATYLKNAPLADATITKSEAMAALLPPAVRGRNRVIPDGVDLSRFGTVDREEARGRLGWPVDEPTVIFVADPARPVKNFPLAQTAVERLARRRPEVRLRVAATVPHAEMPLWMSAADVLLLTSYSEGAPNVVKEAMASALPVVSTPVGDVPELLAGLPGCAVCPYDADALAAGLEGALDHGPTPAARELAARFDVRTTTAQVVEVYEAVLARRNGRAP